MISPRIGIVLTDLGGPADLTQVQPFVESLLSDPAILPFPAFMRSRIARRISLRRAPLASERYRAIGGGSPLHENIVAQIRGLEDRLGDQFVVRHAFRHAPPRAENVLRELAGEGVVRVVITPLFPQRSFTTTDSCISDLESAARRLGMVVTSTPSFPEGLGYIEALRQHASRPAATADHLLLVAHGLPISHVRKGDPYVEEVWQTSKCLMAALERTKGWSLAFQSRLGPAKWVGPYLEEEIERLAAAKVKSLVVIPLSFTNENLETLWDLDIEAARLAASAGIESYLRIPTVADHAAFLDELAEASSQAAREAGWARS